MILIKNDLRERCEVLADFMIQNEATVRKTAQQYGISKSTVHKDLSERLKKINPMLYADVKTLLDKNKAERHIRGGIATQQKFKIKNQGDNCDKCCDPHIK